MALVLSSDTDIAASFEEPDAMLDSRSEERCTSSSTSPASSAYARSDTCTVYGSDPSVIPASQRNSGIWSIIQLEDSPETNNKCYR